MDAGALVQVHDARTDQKREKEECAYEDHIEEYLKRCKQLREHKSVLSSRKNNKNFRRKIRAVEVARQAAREAAVHYERLLVSQSSAERRDVSQNTGSVSNRVEPGFLIGKRCLYCGNTITDLRLAVPYYKNHLTVAGALCSPMCYKSRIWSRNEMGTNMADWHYEMLRKRGFMMGRIPVYENYNMQPHDLKGINPTDSAWYPELKNEDVNYFDYSVQAKYVNVEYKFESRRKKAAPPAKRKTILDMFKPTNMPPPPPRINPTGASPEMILAHQRLLANEYV